MAAGTLIESITADAGSARLENPESWMQGRTLYGGASALIAYTAAIRAFPDLPPLRAAQIGFVAPVGPEMELRREVLRQGRNVVQVRSEIWCEGGCAFTAIWLFGTEREPNALHKAPMAGDAPPPPEQCDDVASAKVPQFIPGNFEVRRAQKERGPGKPILRRWVRLIDADDLDPISQLILMGDVLPPSAARVMQRPGLISSINWSFNVLEVEPQTGGGWWLLENESQHADHGYSSERLRLWNSDGQLILDGMQAVALFG